MSDAITIHQPDHLPWLGFVNKVDQADLYVVLDCVQLSKKVFQRRNRVIGFGDEPTWLTVPLIAANHTQLRLSDIRINNAIDWQRRYKNVLYDRYHSHPYWANHSAYLETLCARSFDSLVELNMDIINYVLQTLRIDTRLVLASSLNPEGKGSDLLLDICRKVGARSYLAGPLSRNYLDEAIFQRENISVRYHSFRHPTYAQHGRTSFTSHLSVLDLILNHGDQSLRIVREGTA